jgi:hypothetical protein
MKRKIIDLDILESLAESGVSALSLVDKPAIEIQWLAFKDQKFVEPKAGENENEFMDRCIPFVVDEGKDADQATAICYSIYEQKFADSYTDYPEGATNNAKRAIEWKEKNGSDCGTAVGWTRARQLADRKPISQETIARMASFERHRQNSDTPYTEGCGGIMWDAWGGDSGVRWAQTKLKELNASSDKFSYDTSGLPVYVDEGVEPKK